MGDAVGPDSLQLLCTGDVHLGRHPTRIPATLDGQSFSPRAIWRSTVEYGIDTDVDAVLVSGDVVDQENQYYEAYGAFEEGATQLDDADIPLLVVAGNHDFSSLPQLVDDLDIDGLHLLGDGGTWERHTIALDGEPHFHVDGWSFPDEHIFESPLGDYDLEPADKPVVGLLHADIDSRESDYAPVDQATLEATPPDAWLLGHIHTPGVRSEADPTVFYPGTPQALDPGDHGTHGPWELRYGESGVDIEQVPLASIRYDSVDVDASGVEDPMDVPALIQDRIEDHVTATVPTAALELLSVRIQLTGRTAAHGDLVRQRERIEEDLGFKVGALPVRIDELTVETTPEVALESVAGDDSPVGYLASLLLALEDGEQEKHSAIIEDASETLRTVHNAGAYTPLRREGRLDPPTTDDAVGQLERQGRLLLHELLEQTEDEA